MQPATDTFIAACALEHWNFQIIAYVGSNQRLYQLVWRDNNWTSIDVISSWQQSAVPISLPFPRTGGGFRGGSPLAIDALEPYQTSLLFYIDTQIMCKRSRFPSTKVTQSRTGASQMPRRSTLTLPTGPRLPLR